METFVKHKKYDDGTTGSSLIGKFAGGTPGIGANILFKRNKAIVFENRYSNDGTQTNYISGATGTNFTYQFNYTQEDIEQGGKIVAISSIADYNNKENQTTFKSIAQGKEVDSKVVTGKIVYSNSNSFWIGQTWDNFASGYPIRDDIYSIRVYNRALTIEESLTNYYIDVYRF